MREENLKIITNRSGSQVGTKALMLNFVSQRALATRLQQPRLRAARALRGCVPLVGRTPFVTNNMSNKPE